MESITFEGVRLEIARVPCAVCGEERQRPFSTEMRHGLNLPTVICVRCGLFYTSPRFTDEAATTFYETLYPSFHGRQDGASEEWVAKAAKNGPPRVERLLQFLAADDVVNVVEIGAGGGGFLSAATARTSWSLVGIEPGQQQTEHMRAKGLHVINQPFGEVDLAALDPKAIVAFHVFEHLNDPMQFLATAREALGDDGYLYLEVPDLAHSPVPMGEFLQAPHNFNFTSITLRNALRLAGFDVRWISERGSTLSMVATPGSIGELETWDIDSFLGRLRDRERLQRVAHYTPQYSVLGKVRSVMTGV